jgi:hypothetical protein
VLRSCSSCGSSSRTSWSPLPFTSISWLMRTVTRLPASSLRGCSVSARVALTKPPGTSKGTGRWYSSYIVTRLP